MRARECSAATEVTSQQQHNNSFSIHSYSGVYDVWEFGVELRLGWDGSRDVALGACGSNRINRNGSSFSTG